MFDPQKLLEQFLGGGSAKGQTGQPQQGGLSPDFMKGLATGGVAGGLAGILLGGKTSKKLAKGTVKLGGTAALGGQGGQWQLAEPPHQPAPEAGLVLFTSGSSGESKGVLLSLPRVLAHLAAVAAAQELEAPASVAVILPLRSDS